jgi:PPIC-type PPIASE domain
MNHGVLDIRLVASDDALRRTMAQTPCCGGAIVPPHGTYGERTLRLGQRQRETHREKCGWRLLAGRTPRRTSLLTAVGLLAIACGLSACGTSNRVAARASDPSPQLRPPTGPEAVLVRVGSHPITGNMVDDLLRAEQEQPGGEPLDPPAFSACVAHLRSESAAAGASPPPAQQLRRECQTRYEELLRTALERVISDEWLIEGEREAGAPVNEGHAPLETRAKLAAVAIRTAVTNGVRPITSEQIDHYYEVHRFVYLTEGERALKIVRTQTVASAAKAKAEIASGKSFAHVAKAQSIEQPVDSMEGLVLELHPHYYGEPHLNEAIFTAQPGVLLGPIGTWFGYFVFDVTKISSEHVKPLAEVEASIRAKLARPSQAQALAAFLAHWKTTWTARTSCDPGDVVPDCRQSKGAPAASLESPSQPG